MAIPVPLAATVAAVLLLAGCAAPSGESSEPADAPMLVMPRIHHDAMRDRAGDYCEPFGGEPALVDWRYRSNFGKRGEWLMQTIWVCREPAE